MLRTRDVGVKMQRYTMLNSTERSEKNEITKSGFSTYRKSNVTYGRGTNRFCSTSLSTNVLDSSTGRHLSTRAAVSRLRLRLLQSLRLWSWPSRRLLLTLISCHEFDRKRMEWGCKDMKRKLLVFLSLVFTLAMAMPVYAAITDQQKAEIDALNKQIIEAQKQIVDKYTEAGEISRAQADAAKANIDATAQYRQQYSQQLGQVPPIPGYGYGYSHGCGYGYGYGGMW